MAIGKVIFFYWRARRSASAVRSIGRAVLRDLLLVEVADREQHRLGVNQVTPFFAVVFEDACLDDRIDRARLLTKAAENALREIDVIARRAAGAVGTLLRFDGDR